MAFLCYHISMPDQSRVALITGVTGQDGSYLSEFLLAKGYRVNGLVRPHSAPNLVNLKAIKDHPRFSIIHGDVTDWSSLIAAMSNDVPDEIYNLAAQSFVGASWEQARLTNEINYMGFLNVLEAVRSLGPEYSKRVRVYQASSSEMYGNAPAPQDERTPMHPRSPYGVSKLAAHRLASVFRESFGMFISCGICFNHESPRRGPQFVTRKIAANVARLAVGLPCNLRLGDLSAKRDWGYAPDYVEAMWMLLQYGEPGDWVVATGETHSVEEFLTGALNVVGFADHDLVEFVTFDESFIRPSEIHSLCGDPWRIVTQVGWKPKTSFADLIRIMVEAESR